jgi:glucose dehydrogenase
MVHASAVVGGVVYVGSWDRNLYAIDATTGRERWRHTTGADTLIYNQVGLASSPAVVDGMVLVGGRDGRFHAVDAATGAERWSHNNRGGWTIGSPAVRDGVVYFASSDGRRFKALDVRTGALRFDLENKAISFSSPALAGTVAYYGTSDGWVHGADVRSGAFTAHFQTDGSKQNGAKWTDSIGVLQTGGMYPDRTLDGMMIGMRTMMTVGSVLSSPVIVDGCCTWGVRTGSCTRFGSVVPAPDRRRHGRRIRAPHVTQLTLRPARSSDETARSLPRSPAVPRASTRTLRARALWWTT